MKVYYLFFLMAFVTAGCQHSNSLSQGSSFWESKLGLTVELKGRAFNAKLGAMLKTEHGVLWLDGVDSWPEGFYGRVVKVKGKVIKQYDLPVFVQKKGEPARTGIPVPEGTDLHKASKRYLLESPKWRLIN